MQMCIIVVICNNTAITTSISAKKRAWNQQNFRLVFSKFSLPQFDFRPFANKFNFDLLQKRVSLVCHCNANRKTSSEVFSKLRQYSFLCRCRRERCDLFWIISIASLILWKTMGEMENFVYHEKTYSQMCRSLLFNASHFFTVVLNFD